MKRNKKYAIAVLGLLSSVMILGVPEPAEAKTFMNTLYAVSLDGVSQKDIPKNLLPAAYKMSDAHPLNDYYERMNGNVGNSLSNDPYLFRGAYKGIYTYYSPIAKGSYLHLQPRINAEEYISENTDQSETGDENQKKLYINGNKNFKNKRTAPGTKDATGKFSDLKPLDKHAHTYYNRGSYRNRPTYGEWRILGYSEKGTAIENPYFPADYFRSESSNGMQDYPLFKEPWNAAISDRLADSRSEIDILAQQYVDGLTFAAQKSAYDTKYEAVSRLLSQRSDWRQHVKNFGGISTNNRAAQTRWLMQRLSLSNDSSSGDTAYFVGIKSDRQMYITDVASAKEGYNRDMGITKQVVKNQDGKVVQTFTRDKNGKVSVSPAKEYVFAGETLTVETTVKNSTKYQMIAPSTQVSHDGTSGKMNSAAGGRLGGNKTATIKQTMKVPSNIKQWKVDTKIHALHNMLYDNSYNFDDDTANNAFKVYDEQGNFKSSGIELIDKNGKIVGKNQAVPGQEYKIRYLYKYSGDNASLPMNIKVDYEITRQLPNGKETKKGTINSGKSNFKPQNGNVYKFETPYFVYETGVFNTSSTLKLTSNAKHLKHYNTSTKDDSQSANWTGTYDYKVSNVKVIPTETVNTTNQEAKVLVKFDVDHQVPSHVTDYANDVEFYINIAGKNVLVKEHIQSGTNRNVSVPIDVNLSGSNQTLKATVVANPNVKVYETDLSNNTGSGTGQIKNEEQVRAYNNNARNKEWKQYYEVNDWTGKAVNYPSFNNSKKFSFIDYKRNTPRTLHQELKETYKIDHVWFKSKFTVDNKLGPDKNGWVDLLEENGKIKAGYGYELKIDVSYNTDAFKNTPENILGQSGKWARPRLAEALIPNNVYMQAPDDKLYSVDGDGGTKAQLEVQSMRGTTRGTKNWTYRIKNATAMGESVVGKFYIGEEVSNGQYDMRVFTPKIAGVAGKMTEATKDLNHQLFDSREVTIEVVGSATDDVTDHIND